MFGSSILEVAIGLMLCFLGVSLIASTTTQMVATILSYRGRVLVQAIKDLLNDSGGTRLAKEILNHGAVNPRAPGNAGSTSQLGKRPTDIDSLQFAGAIIDIVGLARTDLGGALAKIQADARLDTQTKTLFSGIVQRAANAAGDIDIDKMRLAIASWFDQSMEEVTALYKRNTGYAAFVFALVAAILLNIDVLYVGGTIWKESRTAGLTVNVGSIPQPDAAGATNAAPLSGSAPLSGAAPAKRDVDAIKSVVEALNAAQLPVGWSVAGKTDADTPLRGRMDSVAKEHGGWLYMLLGWLIAALASLFGAQFWYDALTRLIPLRKTGSDTAKEGQS